MKTILPLLIVLFCAQINWAQEQKLRVYLDSKQFYEPSIGNFVEVNFQFVSPTLKYYGVAGGLQGELAIFMDIVQNNDTITSDAFRVLTPLMKDSILEDFYDVRRFQLAPGVYDLHLEISDLVRKSDPVKGTVKLTIEDKSKNIGFSDIQNIEYAIQGKETSVFFKSGYEIIPRLSNYYSSELTSLPYYTEIYNTLSLNSTDFGLKECVIDSKSNKEIERYTQFVRQKSAGVVPVLRQIDLTELPSGSYFLSLTVLNSKMEEISTKKYFFDRVSDFEPDITATSSSLDSSFEKSIPLDSAEFYLASLIPIAKPNTARTILTVLKEKNNEKSKLLIQNFWLTNDRLNAYENWIKYKQQVLLVEKIYSNHFLRGYESDRGRVYLQYGAPTNLFVKETSPSEYPYEIWQYNKIGNFSNKRFIFYNPDLITNNYRLLHSDLIGETKNVNWANALLSKSSLIDQNEAEDQQNHFGGQASDIFKQF